MQHKLVLRCLQPSVVSTLTKMFPLWFLKPVVSCFWAGDYAGFPGCGLLRLHSTYRHDLKIYASDEGRVQMTAAAFAKVSEQALLVKQQDSFGD